MRNRNMHKQIVQDTYRLRLRQRLCARDALGLPPTDRAPRHDADPQIREWYRSYAEAHPEVAESGRRPSGAAS